MCSSDLTQAHYGLAQARLRELMLARVSGEQQAQIHQRIGHVLERRERHAIGRVLEPLAWHFEQGRLPGKGYAYLSRAGMRRLERSFMLDAADYFGRALVLEPEARTWLPLDEADRRLAELLLARARAFEHLGQVEEAMEDLMRAHRLAGELQDERLLARAAGDLGQQSRLLGRLDDARTFAMEAEKLSEKLGEIGRAHV